MRHQTFGECHWTIKKSPYLHFIAWHRDELTMSSPYKSSLALCMWFMKLAKAWSPHYLVIVAVMLSVIEVCRVGEDISSSFICHHGLANVLHFSIQIWWKVYLIMCSSIVCQRLLDFGLLVVDGLRSPSFYHWFIILTILYFAGWWAFLLNMVS